MKILFVWPNTYLSNGIPTGIATLVAVLKLEGHSVDVFDWTFIKTEVTNAPSTANKGLYMPTSHTLEDLVANDPVQSLEDAFASKLNAFQPDLVALSVMTGYFDEAVRLLQRVQPRCMVVAGGVHPTICPEDALATDVIDCICVGEGEEFLLELCDDLQRDADYTRLHNLGYKRGKNLILNDLRPFVDLDVLPPPDWSCFDSRHLFRPYLGKVYSGSFYTLSRGCPYKCAYCVNSALRQKLKPCGEYFRYQSWATTASHLKSLKDTYGATWFKFADDSLGSLDERALEDLAEALRPLNIMFGCSIRPETVTRRKVELLRSMGCVAATVGVESGNNHIRREVLKRKMTDDQICRAARFLKDTGIRVATFNMIGLPGETRENVFETIRLNKRLGASATNVYVVYPYPGTELSHQYRAHFRDSRGAFIPVSDAAGFELSNMSRAEVEGLLRTFDLYVKLPEALWPKVRESEADNPLSSAIRVELEESVVEHLTIDGIKVDPM